MTPTQNWRSYLSTPYTLIALFYLYVAALVRPVHPGDDWFFFTEIANMFLDGKGLLIYSVREGGGASPYPFSYPPLAALVLVPFQFLARLADLPEPLQSPLVSFPYLVGDVACAGLLVALIRSYRSLSDDLAYAIFGGFLFSFAVFFSTAWHGHQETSMVACLLAGFLALRKETIIPAALWMMAALAFKTTALMFVVPAVVCVFGIRGPREGARLAAIALGGFALSMLPWLIADSSNTLYMLKGFPASMPVGSQSSWYALGPWVQTDRFDALRPHVNTVIALIWLAYSAWMVRRLRPSLSSPAVVGICASCGILALLLQKAGSLHYSLPSLVILAVWEASRKPGGLPWMAIMVTGVLSNIAAAHLLPGELSFNFATAWGQIVLFSVALIYLHFEMQKAPAPSETGAFETAEDYSATTRGLVVAVPPSTTVETVPPEVVGAAILPNDAG